MNVFELIKEKLKELNTIYYLTIANTGDTTLDLAYRKVEGALEKAKIIVDEVAQEYNKNKHTDEYIKGYNQGTIDRADEIQKAREYGYNKGIDEFAERLKIKDKYLTVTTRIIDEIAEQLKGGSDGR